MSVVVVVDIPVMEFESRGNNAERGIERSLIGAVKEILKRVGQAQATIYTQNTRPSKPPGSTYHRTFGLRGSSSTEVTHDRLPLIEGEWRATALHARYVLGRAAEQAFIHRGRWKSIEEVEREVDNVAVEITERHLGSIK